MRMHRTLVLVLTLVLAFGLAVSAMAKPNTLIRAEIEEQYKWNLADIYESWEAWEADLEKIQQLMAEFQDYKGTLDQGSDRVLEFVTLQDELMKLAYKAYSYPSLMYATDMSKNEVQARTQQVGIMFAQFSQQTAWVTPEILTIPRETMEQWIDQTPALEPYRFPLMEIYREQEHVLDEDGERLLSYFSQFNGTPSNVRSMLATADVKFPEVVLSNGDTMKATHGNYEVSRYAHRNQEDREKVFKAHFSTFDDFENTYAALYNGVLQRDWALAQARNYESCAKRALDGNNIPVAVMTTLLETAKKGNGPLQRYMELRQQVLGLERYRYFDAYLPLVDVDWPFPYDDMKPLIVKSVEPFGKSYQETVARSFDERWFDVYETEGKRSGAFSSGVYGVHPYMLLNYGDTMEDAMTLAHEMGHTMHTVLSHENQPFATSDYTIFVAEVASTMNEHMFTDLMLEKTEDPKKRVALLQMVIDRISQTFYRQAMFADFEYRAHQAVEQGQPITAASLQKIYLATLNDYFGDSLDDQEWYKNQWARIPHFFRPFYVYQYATSIAASSLIHEKITEGDKKARQEAVKGYLQLLKSGGDDHPVAQMEKAGIDMTDAATYQAMVDRMEMLVGKLEQELRKLEMID